MAEIPGDATPWLSVIGRSLAYLCLEKARERDSKKFEDVLAKVDFLMGIGLTEKDAAETSGTTIQSVRVLRRHHGRKKERADGKGKTKRR